MKKLIIPFSESVEILSGEEMKMLLGGESSSTSAICVGATDYRVESSYKCFSTAEGASNYSTSNGESVYAWWACNNDEAKRRCAGAQTTTS